MCAFVCYCAICQLYLMIMIANYTTYPLKEDWPFQSHIYCYTSLEMASTPVEIGMDFDTPIPIGTKGWGRRERSEGGEISCLNRFMLI